MRLVADWRRILKRAWSIRLTLLAGAFAGLEVALPLLDGFWDIEPGRFAALFGVTSAASLISRLLAQSTIPEKTS